MTFGFIMLTVVVGVITSLGPILNYFFGPQTSRDVGGRGLPILMLFEHANLTVEDANGLRGTNVVLENDTAVFRNQDGEDWASGRIGEVVGKNGFWHGDMSITVFNSIGHEEKQERGTWVIVDTRNESEADAETIEVFKRLMQRSGVFDDSSDADEDVQHMVKALERSIENA